MNLQQIRWPVVVIALAVALGALFGAGFLLKNQTVDQPLQQRLGQAEAIESFQVVRGGDQVKITVRLKAGGDLKEAFTQIDTEVRSIMKSVPYMISIEDQRSPALSEVARRLDLYVQEALVTGQFAAMADRIEAEAAQVGATAQVGVDSRRVYLSLRQSEHYLFSVVERATDRPLRKEGGFAL